jgi:hypothetical protein
MAQRLLQASAQTAKLAVLLLGFGGDDAASWAQAHLGTKLRVFGPETADTILRELQQLAAEPPEAFEREPAGQLNAFLARLYASAHMYESADTHFR